jgi:hypothetical protein
MDKGGYAPHEPFRSHQDWEGSLSLWLLKPALNHALQMRLTHLPQALIPVPERLPLPKGGRPRQRLRPALSALTPSSKSGAKTSHHSLT